MTTIAPGTVLGGYRLDGLLGEGGMATVYRGVQLSLDRPVAVKVLPTELAADPGLVARFEREGKALAALSHPNITSIIDRGNQDGHYYFVMELVDGEDLHARLRRERPSIGDTFRIVHSVLEALSYAHERGIVHRDIKPSNVLLTARGRVKVTDFGIATLRGAGDLGLTRIGSSVGTASYMAPEQRTDASNVDGRADLFSLGVLFYEALTGSLPIGAFPPASELAPGLPAGTDGLIHRALQLRPKDRHADAAAMISALVAIAPSTAPPTPLPVTPPPASAPDVPPAAPEPTPTPADVPAFVAAEPTPAPRSAPVGVPEGGDGGTVVLTPEVARARAEAKRAPPRPPTPPPAEPPAEPEPSYQTVGGDDDGGSSGFPLKRIALVLIVLVAIAGIVFWALDGKKRKKKKGGDDDEGASTPAEVFEVLNDAADEGDRDRFDTVWADPEDRAAEKVWRLMRDENVRYDAYDVDRDGHRATVEFHARGRGGSRQGHVELRRRNGRWLIRD